MIEWIIPLSIIGLIILGMQIKDYKYPSQIQKEFTKEFNKQWEQIKMTEKRFKIKYINEQHISANLYDDKIFIGSIGIGAELIVELLNNLSEENDVLKQQLKTKVIVNKQYEELQKLKQENEQLKKALMELKEIGDYQEGRIKELSDENDQLQEELEQCKAVIDNRWSEYLKEKELQE